MTSWQQTASWNAGDKHTVLTFSESIQPAPHCPSPLGIPNWVDSPAFPLVANAQCLSLFPILQMARMCSLVISSMDTGPQTSLSRVGGTGWLSSSCTLPILRQQLWPPFRASFFKPPCLIERSLVTSWLPCLASTPLLSPAPSALQQ